MEEDRLLPRPTSHRVLRIPNEPCVAGSAGARQEAQQSLGKAGRQIVGKHWSEKDLSCPLRRPWEAGTATSWPAGEGRGPAEGPVNPTPTLSPWLHRPC